MRAVTCHCLFPLLLSLSFCFFLFPFLLPSPPSPPPPFGAPELPPPARNGANLGDSSVRPFAPPKLNWHADSIRNIQDWSNATEPLLTSSIPSTELPQFLATPLQIPKIPCHTQSCERAVKEVTIASSHVFGPERRDGYIRAKIKSRKLFSKNETKKDLEALLTS